MKRCSFCGKEFDVLWPDLWRYKKGPDINHTSAWFCSWKCLRADEKGEEKPMKNNKQEEIALKLVEAMEKNGADPIEYLKGQGYGNPEKAYQNIKYRCREKRPDLYERFPKRRENREPEEKDPAEAVKQLPAPDLQKFDRDMITRQVRENVKESLREEETKMQGRERVIRVNIEAEPLEVAKIRSRVLKASYSYDEDLGTMTLDGPDLVMNMITMAPKDWVALCGEIIQAMDQLGVKEP